MLDPLVVDDHHRDGQAGLEHGLCRSASFPREGCEFLGSVVYQLVVLNEWEIVVFVVIVRKVVHGLMCGDLDGR